VDVSLQTTMQENVSAVNAQGADVRLRYRKFDVGLKVDGEARAPSPRLQRVLQDIGNVELLLRVDNRGNLVSSQLDLGRTAPPAQAFLQDMNEQIRSSLEALAGPLPGPGGPPGEKGRAARNLPITTAGGAEFGGLEMEYTYAGRRSRHGRDEAVILLGGNVRGRQGQQRHVGGRARGTALVDLATGQVT